MESLSDPLEICRAYQQDYYENLGYVDWNVYKSDEYKILKSIIGYALYEAPTNFGTDANETGYNTKQNTQINFIYQQIMKNHYIEDPNSTMIRIIFIMYQINDKKKAIGKTPVFVVKKCTCTSIFIDDSGRVYQSWSLYLQKNLLPKCIMVYPVNGQYSGSIRGDVTEDAVDGKVEVKLDVRESPACNIESRLLEGADTAGTVTSVGSTLIFLGALIPSVTVAPALLTAAVVGGVASGLYSLGRSVGTLVDKNEHSQSISLRDSEARACWLNATAGVLGMSASGASGLLTKATSRGVYIGTGTKAAFNTLHVANLIGTSTCLANMSYSVIDKIISGEPMSPLEVFQLTSSILFFHNSVVGFKTASAIITETQASTLQNYSESLRSNRHRKLFRKAQLESRRLHGTERGNAEIISGIRKINDQNNFFAGLARTNKNLNAAGARYTINSDGKITINSAYIVDPAEFAGVPKDDRLNILNQLPLPNTSVTIDTLQVKSTFLANCIKNSAESCVIDIIPRIAKDMLSSRKDTDSMTVLLLEYSEEVTKKILKILLEFLAHATLSVVNDFKSLCPIVSVSIGLLQFLLFFVSKLAKENNITWEQAVLLFFNHDGSVEHVLIEKLTNEMAGWINQKLKKTFRSLQSITAVNMNKIRKYCSYCKGLYYVST